MTAATAFALAAALHAGFQLTVTALVYPALVRVAPDRWAAAHGRHSRGIAPLVAVVYGALAGCGLWTLLTAPLGVALVVALACAAGSGLTTALAAAPTHRRLGAAGPRAQLLRRLLAADRVRCAFAVVAAVAAVVAVL